MTVEQKAEEKSFEYISEENTSYSAKLARRRFVDGFLKGYRECEKEWQKKADYLTGKKE